jgi:dCTP deaminase
MFWSTETWREKCDSADGGIVVPFNSKNLGEAKYELSIGDEVYVSAKDGLIKRLSVMEGFAIDPGQFAFLLTAETLNIPLNCIGFISIRARTKFMGLVNISGFHVDPGYNGKLIFAVFNAGPTRIHLRQGEKIFSLWMANVDKSESGNVNRGYDSIPSKLVNQISAQFVTAYQVKSELDAIKDDINHLKLWRWGLAGAFGVFVLLFGKVISERVYDFFKTEIARVDGQGAQSAYAPPMPFFLQEKAVQYVKGTSR